MDAGGRQMTALKALVINVIRKCETVSHFDLRENEGGSWRIFCVNVAFSFEI
jgi:hypothetical protein